MKFTPISEMLVIPVLLPQFFHIAVSSFPSITAHLPLCSASSFVLKPKKHSFSFESYLDCYSLLFFTVPLAVSFSLQFLSQLDFCQFSPYP